MKLYLKNLLLPGSDSIMSSFTKAISALEAKASASTALSISYRSKAFDAEVEATRSGRLAKKLREAFTI